MTGRQPDAGAMADGHPRAAQIDAAPPVAESPAGGAPEPAATATAPGSGSDGGASSAPVAASRAALGRLVHEQRLAFAAEQAAAEGRQRFVLSPWEERTPEQQALDEAVAAAVAVAERERIRGAVLEVMATFQTHYGPGGGRADDLMEAVRQVLDREPPP